MGIPFFLPQFHAAAGMTKNGQKMRRPQLRLGAEKRPPHLNWRTAARDFRKIPSKSGINPRRPSSRALIPTSPKFGNSGNFGHFGRNSGRLRKLKMRNLRTSKKIRKKLAGTWKVKILLRLVSEVPKFPRIWTELLRSAYRLQVSPRLQVFRFFKFNLSSQIPRSFRISEKWGSGWE